jgi:hypothetical protein
MMKLAGSGSASGSISQRIRIRGSGSTQKCHGSAELVCTVPQSVRYHNFPPPRESYMSATSQARLNGVLGQTSMYETCLSLPHPLHPVSNYSKILLLAH